MVIIAPRRSEAYSVLSHFTASLPSADICRIAGNKPGQCHIDRCIALDSVITVIEIDKSEIGQSRCGVVVSYIDQPFRVRLNVKKIS